jgi:hypothetical protein
LGSLDKECRVRQIPTEAQVRPQEVRPSVS